MLNIAKLATGLTTVALTVAMSPVAAAELGNLAATVTIRKLHQTGTASPAEIRRAWRNQGLRWASFARPGVSPEYSPVDQGFANGPGQTLAHAARSLWG